MAFPFVAALGAASAGAGLLGSIFGKKKKSSAPVIRPQTLEEQITDVNSALGGALLKSRDLSNQNLDIASNLTGDITGLTRDLGNAPTIQGADLAEYENAQNTFKQFLDLAKINTINETAVGMKTASSALGLSGYNRGGAGETNLLSSIAAKNQASLNSTAAQVGSELVSYRSGLLSNIYNRLLTRYNATLSSVGQATSQGSALMGNVFNALNTNRSYNTTLQSQNAQMQFAADTANQQSSQSGFSSMLSAGTSLLSAFIGKK
jgi:hypothetical protein